MWSRTDKNYAKESISGQIIIIDGAIHNLPLAAAEYLRMGGWSDMTWREERPKRITGTSRPEKWMKWRELINALKFCARIASSRQHAPMRFFVCDFLHFTCRCRLLVCYSSSASSTAQIRVPFIAEWEARAEENVPVSCLPACLPIVNYCRRRNCVRFHYNTSTIRRYSHPSSPTLLPFIHVPSAGSSKINQIRRNDQ